MWSIVLITLLLLWLAVDPARYLALLIVPPLGLWQRRRVEQRIDAWAMDLLDT